MVLLLSLSQQNNSPHLLLVLCQSIFNILHYIIDQMEQIRTRTSNKPKKYATISLSQRISLVKLIKQEKYSISKASKKLSIRLSTAKLIMKRYRQDGSFFQKRSDRMIRRIIFEEHHQNISSSATPHLQNAQRSSKPNQVQQNNKESQQDIITLFFAQNANNYLQNSNFLPIYYFGFSQANTVPYNYFPFWFSND